MRTSLLGLPGIAHRGEPAMPTVAPAEATSPIAGGGLGPFFVRRFVDFARTESMICRPAA